MDQGDDHGHRRRGRGGPGLAFGSSGPGVETKSKAKTGKAKAAAKAEKTQLEDTAATASTSTTAPATSAKPLPDAASVAATSQASKGKQQLRPLDAEMTIVANKHTGTSTKCLHGLVPSTYLDEPREKVSRHTLAANLRGVTWLFAIRTLIVFFLH